MKKQSVLALLLFCFIPYTVLAQNTVLIEAEKISSQEIEASRSSIIVNEENLKNKNPATVVDILREIPGVQVFRQGGIGQTATVFIRGAKSESTLVLIDGVEANDVMSPSGGFDFSSLSPNNILRIEIYRGPQSVRFGAGSLGGVINIITKEGKGHFGLDYSLEGGTYNSRHMSARASGENKVLGYSIGLDGFRSDGFSAAAGGSERDSAELSSAAAKLVYQKSPITKVESTFRYLSAHVDLDRGGGAASDDPNYTSDASQMTVSLYGETRFNEGSILSSLRTSMAKNERESENLVDTASTEFSDDHFESEHYKVETGHELYISNSHRVRLDVQWREESGQAESSFNGVNDIIGKKNQSVLGEALTYFYEDDLWFGDIGLRSDQPSDESNIVSSRASIGRFFDQNKSKIYFAYGTGFKLPSLYQRYSKFGTPTLDSEKSQTYELSIHKSISSQVSTSLALFNNTFRHMIDYDSSTNKYLNIAKARSRGLELQSDYQFENGFLGGGLTAQAGYNYLDAEDESTGLALLRRPRQSFSFGLNYIAEKFNLTSRYVFRGHRTDSDPVSFKRTSQGSYGVVDLGGEYKINESINLKVRIENIFDKNYEEVAGYTSPGLSIYAGLNGRL